MPRDSMREVIFDFVQRLGPCTVDRLVEASGLGQSTVRRHVQALVGEGRVMAAGAEENGERGRNPTTYQVS